MRSFRIEENPPAVHPEGAEICDLVAMAPTWFLFTAKYIAGKPCVKRLAFHLRAQDVGYYLPLVKSIRTYPDGTRHTSLRPLFGPYIFAALKPGQFVESKYLDSAKQIHEDWKLIPQLARLKHGIDAGNIRSLSDLKCGAAVRIKSGAYRECEGKVERIDYAKECAYLVGLMPNAEIEIDLAILEPV